MSRRVTFFINALRGGGAEQVCVTLANELARMQWDIEILVLNLRDAVVRQAVDPAIPVVELGADHARSAVAAIARYLRGNRPEQFLVFNHQLAVLLVWLRALRIGRFSIVARNISTLSRKARFEPSFWHSRIVPFMTSVFYRHVDLVIAQSQGMRQDLIEHFGVDGRRIKVIYNPLAERFARRRAEGLARWSNRRLEILYVGRLAAIKGLDLLLDACAICMRRHPGLVLRLVGAGDQIANLRRRAAIAGITERVVFEGYVADVGEYYARARLLALTSHYEGFPNVLVEAISQGTPVVSVDCASGPAEIITQGVNGFLVGNRDPAAFAAAIERILATDWDVDAVSRSVDRYASREIAAQYGEHLAALSA